MLLNAEARRIVVGAITSPEAVDALIERARRDAQAFEELALLVWLLIGSFHDELFRAERRLEVGDE